MTSKLKIKIGDLELEYEGTEDFLKQEFPAILKTAMELQKVATKSENLEAAGKGTEKRTGTKLPGDGKGENKSITLTTTSIAARLKVDSGPDLMLAAAAQLTLVAKKDTFSRVEILTEMQKATAYYKKSYSTNLSRCLNGAISDGKLSETATDAYALTASARDVLETQLVDP